MRGSLILSAGVALLPHAQNCSGPPRFWVTTKGAPVTDPAPLPHPPEEKSNGREFALEHSAQERRHLSPEMAAIPDQPLGDPLGRQDLLGGCIGLGSAVQRKRDTARHLDIPRSLDLADARRPQSFQQLKAAVVRERHRSPSQPHMTMQITGRPR